ncbi:MAG: type VI secretion system baseplate subunit TssF [Deltaproteobacteria bacterium]|nr:type VI secretion system baseplate subunit TssF [Deltaproteobacteria bacterium]
MIKNYYQEELNNIRELAREFSRVNPAIAPLLGSKGDDPDVERLLEGVAFMSGMVRRTMDEGFPRLIQSLMLLLYPQALLPAPSCTMMRFQPVKGFTQTIKLKAGSEVASIPVDGATARFSVTRDLLILPAGVTEVKSERLDSGVLKIALTIQSSAPLSAWLPGTLSLYFDGEYAVASERRRIILQYAKRVEAGTISGGVALPEGSLEAGGLENAGTPQERLQEAFSLMRDYFAFPHKFLFLEISGIRERVDLSGNRLNLIFFLEGFKGSLPSMRPEDFLLNVVPAINVFKHPAVPVQVDHRRNDYLLRPQDSESGRISVYRVLEVAARGRDGKARTYVPFERYAEREKGGGCYSVSLKKTIQSRRAEHYITVHYLPDAEPVNETLSVSLECNNYGVTEQLHTGEIRVPAEGSPVMATFSNIIPPTRYVDDADEGGRNWSILSHLFVNLAPLLTVDTLRELLDQYALPGDTDVSRRLGNRKRLEAVAALESSGEDYFLRGRPVHGNRLDLTLDLAGFASMGDMRLFGDALDRFLGLFHHINTYSRLRVVEKNSHEELNWNPRLGTKRLV